MADNADTMLINYKTTKGQKEAVTVAVDCTVADLKAAIAEKSTDLEASTQRVIYKGRVLKDDQTCESYGLSEGQMVIVVSKKPKKARTTTPAQAQTTPAQPTNPAPSNPTNPTQSQANPAQANPQINPFASLM